MHQVNIHEAKTQLSRLIQEALEFHIEGLKKEGLPVPEPTTRCEYIAIALDAD